MEINPEYFLEGLMLKLKLQYFGYLMRTANSWKCPWWWEILRAEGEKGVGGWDRQKASPMQWTWTWANFRRWWGTGRPGVLQTMGSRRVGHDWATVQQQQQYCFCYIVFAYNIYIHLSTPLSILPSILFFKFILSMLQTSVHFFLNTVMWFYFFKFNLLKLNKQTNKKPVH